LTPLPKRLGIEKPGLAGAVLVCLNDAFENMKPDRSSPLADPAQAETQQQLLDAAQAIFAEVGFHDATIRQICERAGANPAAVHNHFGDKQTLSRAAMRQTCLTATAHYPLRKS
jgi:AcrR family transcriptional regulator